MIETCWRESLVSTDTPVSVTAWPRSSPAMAFTSSLHTLIAHHVGVLRHGAQQVAVLDQARGWRRTCQSPRRSTPLSPDSLDWRCLHAGGGAFVTAEDANHALGDIVLGNGLGLGGVAFAVLGLEDVRNRCPQRRSRKPVFALRRWKSVAALTFTMPMLPEVTPCCVQGLEHCPHRRSCRRPVLSVEKVASASTLAGEST